MPPAEQVLKDEDSRRVVRVGDTVRRPLAPWSASVHDLLAYLRSVGLDAAPEVLGIDDEGREVLRWVDGVSGPDAWPLVADEDGLAAMGHLLRDYHAAVAGYRPPDDTAWHTGSPPWRPGDVVCHGDFGPWNLVWRNGRPVAILDWDYAGPGRPLDDVAYALVHVTPFRDDEESVRWLGHRQVPDRRRRLEIFAAAAGMTTTDGLVDAVVARQHQWLRLVRVLAVAGHEPQRTWLTTGLEERHAQNVAWAEQHRHLFA